jgi:hypothetical protein
MPPPFASTVRIFMLTCVFAGLLPVVSAQSSDESGTLVTVARTADSVIVSIDSMITHYDWVSDLMFRNVSLMERASS